MQTRPKVTSVITRLNVGGPARLAILVTRALEEQGFFTELVSGSVGSREGILEASDASHTGVASLKRRIDPLADFRTARALKDIFTEQRPDIVHTHMAKAGTLGRIAARQARVPVILHTFHGHVLDEYFSKPVSKLFGATERYLSRWTDALIAVSPSVRDFLLALGVGKPSQWHVIPVGLELDDLVRPPPPKDESRKRLGLPADGPAVGIVGRLVPIKDHSTFLEAARVIANVRSDVTFVVAGDGESRVPLQARAEQMLGDHVRFLGWVFDLPALYGCLDVVVLSSRNEGTPVALIEAGAAAKPVVATRVGGVPDVVRDGETGYLVAPGDGVAMARGILELLDNPQRATAMGAAAREWVRPRFSAARLVEDIIELYCELLGRKGIELPDKP
jgi:glycosyltransferase involved in cell wall biosynthesis